VRFLELIPVLQMAIGPVILISGIGLLMLSMTNRFGRVIDRSRLVAEARRRAAHPLRDALSAQLEMLQRRASLLRMAISLAISSVLMAVLLIISVFLLALSRSEWGLPIIVLFFASMAFLISSLIVFIQDLNLSLEALKLEVSLSDSAAANSN
jgi:hypothetical protein